MYVDGAATPLDKAQPLSTRVASDRRATRLTLAATAAFYNNRQNRPYLYRLPERRTRYWSQISHVGPECTERVILGADTPGFVVAHPDPVTVPGSILRRVTNWQTLPDLLFLNPLKYFTEHPTVESLWIELHDPAQPVIEVYDPTDVDPIQLALILRRCELTWTFCDWIRQHQCSFFDVNELILPDEDEFVGSIGGK